MTAVYLNFLTERSRIDHCPFLVGPYTFFKPYHLTCMAIIRDFVSYGFSTKLRGGPYILLSMAISVGLHCLIIH